MSLGAQVPFGQLFIFSTCKWFSQFFLGGLHKYGLAWKNIVLQRLNSPRMLDWMHHVLAYLIYVQHDMHHIYPNIWLGLSIIWKQTKSMLLHLQNVIYAKSRLFRRLMTSGRQAVRFAILALGHAIYLLSFSPEHPWWSRGPNWRIFNLGGYPLDLDQVKFCQLYLFLCCGWASGLSCWVPI